MDDSQRALATLLIDGLRLEGIAPDDLDPQAPLFGGTLGLDSIDALEIALLVERHYHVRLDDTATGMAAFASLTALDAYIRAQVSAAGA